APPAPRRPLPWRWWRRTASRCPRGGGSPGSPTSRHPQCRPRQPWTSARRW
ncbi:unnamed protein product, partial [Prorocentrum cordatum]